MDATILDVTDSACPWCADEGAGDEVDAILLCRSHEAEFDGLTEDQLDSRDAAQLAEYLDTLN